MAVNPVLHHVTLKTTRVEEMVAWYGLVVGMTTNHHSRFGTWMTNDAANHRIALLAHPGLTEDPDKIPHAGMHHMAFEYPGLDERLETYERLKGDGVGNSVEVQADNFGDWTASSEWMRTAPECAVNPIGVALDPEQMVDARRSGAEAAALHQRTFAGEFDTGAPLDLRLPPETAPLA